MFGSAVDNVLSGRDGDDRLYGRDGNDTLDGGNQDDFLQGGAGSDHLDGGAGVDTIDYNGDAGVMVDLTGGHGYGGEAVGDTISGVENVQGTNGFNDNLGGSAADNVLSGWGGNDALYGLDGNDTLQGMDGNDHLVGGAGADTLSGGTGADRFVFGYTSDSPVGAGDVIVDFSQAEGDTIMLSPIDADATTAGDQAFHFIGSAAFGHHAGELHESIASGVTTVSGDVNGDGVADFSIALTGSITLATGDFVL
jgi:Ca2+-binding RTX toxin-like protein